MPIGRIYLIRNLTNGKCYIGQTINSVRSRWTAHRAASKRGSSAPFHRAIRKHGEQSFRLVELCVAYTLEELNELESVYIHGLRTLSPRGYNLDSGGKNYSTHPETKAKIAAANKGRPSARKGKKHRPESIEKMRLAQLGKPGTRLGHHHSPEAKAKLSAARTGKPGTPHTEQFKQRLSERNQGNSYSLGLRRSDGWRDGQRQFAVKRERRPDGTFKRVNET